jgi:hypothetical protein
MKLWWLTIKSHIFKALESRIKKTIFACWQWKVNSANLNS